MKHRQKRAQLFDQLDLLTEDAFMREDPEPQKHKPPKTPTPKTELDIIRNAFNSTTPETAMEASEFYHAYDSDESIDSVNRKNSTKSSFSVRTASTDVSIMEDFESRNHGKRSVSPPIQTRSSPVSQMIAMLEGSSRLDEVKEHAVTRKTPTRKPPMHSARTSHEKSLPRRKQPTVVENIETTYNLPPPPPDYRLHAHLQNSKANMLNMLDCLGDIQEHEQLMLEEHLLSVVKEIEESVPYNSYKIRRLFPRNLVASSNKIRHNGQAYTTEHASARNGPQHFTRTIKKITDPA